MNTLSPNGVLFWSGGKDAWLALQQIKKSYQSLYILVTYDREREVVPIQEIPISTISQQARKLNLPLILIPLPPACSNEIYISSIIDTLNQKNLTDSDLIFGDLHISEIRQWRENEFGNRGLTCRFPIWQIPYEQLFDQLFSSDIKIEISSVDENYRDVLEPGTPFSRRLLEQLPRNIDPMGENGEFHTRVDLH